MEIDEAASVKAHWIATPAFESSSCGIFMCVNTEKYPVRSFIRVVLLRIVHVCTCLHAAARWTREKLLLSFTKSMWAFARRLLSERMESLQYYH